MESTAILRRCVSWGLDLTFVSSPTDEDDDAEADATQEHDSCHSDKWTGSLGDRLRLSNHNQSTFNVGQHSLCRCDPVLGVRKPRFGFTHSFDPTLQSAG